MAGGATRRAGFAVVRFAVPDLPLRAKEHGGRRPADANGCRADVRPCGGYHEFAWAAAEGGEAMPRKRASVQLSTLCWLHVALASVPGCGTVASSRSAARFFRTSQDRNIETWTRVLLNVG